MRSAAHEEMLRAMPNGEQSQHSGGLLLLGIAARGLRIVTQLALVAGALAAASCGSSSNSGSPPVATPSPLGSFTAPPLDGLTVTFNVAPGAPPGTTVSVTSSATAPGGVPAPSSIGRLPQSIAGAVPFLYISVELSQPVPAALFIDEVLTLTNAFSPNASYYLEIDDPSATPPKLTAIAGTDISGVVTFTNANGSGGSGLQTLAASHVYVFEFYYVAGASAPSPTPTPTPPPPGVLSVNPTAVQLYGTGSSNAATTLVQETGYGGTFAESDACAGIATVAPSSGTGPATTFTVTGVAAGNCNATFSDTLGQHVGATITVTVSQFGVDARARGAVP